MSSCCHDERGEGATRACPVSTTAGRHVELLTVKALLRESALGRIRVLPHYFCSDRDCDVVYFDGAGNVYLQDEIRVPVWQKQSFGTRMICYCFGENEGGIRAELETSTTASAVARVRAHIAGSRCACEIRNPRGVCCLGELIEAVARVQTTITERAARPTLT